VFRKDAPYFARLVSPAPTSRVLETVDYVFRLNDPYDFSVYMTTSSLGDAMRLGCFPGQHGINQTGNLPVMHIAKLPQCANEFRGPQSWCGHEPSRHPPYLPYGTVLKVGQKWSPKGTGSGSPYPGTCKSLGGRNRNGPSIRTGRKKRDFPTQPQSSVVYNDLATRVDFLNNNSSCSPLVNISAATIDPPQIRIKGAYEYFVHRSSYTLHKDFITWEHYQNEVNEQTQKIMRNVLDFHLGEIEQKNDTKIKLQRPSRIDAFRYIQLSRNILEAVCPGQEVPSFVLAFMVRLFRIILIDVEERHKYPEFLRANSTINNEVLKALTECKSNAKPIFFMYNETCPSQGVYGTNDSTNGSNIFFDNINLTMPTDLKWEPGALDFPLETVWKMMVFVHYYCAPYFLTPLLHSEFVVKYEAFFNNPSVLFRWYGFAYFLLFSFNNYQLQIK